MRNPLPDAVGYSHTEVPSYYSFFTPQFKGIGKKLNLDDLTPMLTNCNALTANNHVSIQIFKDSEKGSYSLRYGWYPKIEGGCWSLDGSAKHPDTVEFGPGEGFVIYQNVRINLSGSNKGKEATIGNNNYCPIFILHSGEVDLTQQHYVPSYYSFNGNNTFETINLDQLVPTLTNGVALTANNHVSIQIFKDSEKGTYSMRYGWYPKLEGGCWSLNGSEKHPDTVEFKPGEGYVIYQNVRINLSGSNKGKEATIGNNNYCPIFMTVREAE